MALVKATLDLDQFSVDKARSHHCPMNEKGQRSGCSKIVLPALKGKKVGVWTEIDHPTLSVFETRTLSSHHPFPSPTLQT